MIDAYLSKSPNPYKIHIFLEETQLPHKLIWVDVTVGDHKTPEFLKVSPNAKIPAIVDHDPVGGGAPVEIFESAAILIYLAEKTGNLLPPDIHGRMEVMKWLIWQVAGLGPMCGQLGHFSLYAPKDNPYALTRYRNEALRLYGVLEKQLAGRTHIAGDYSIADIACYPWIRMSPFSGIDLAQFPNLQRWLDTVSARPAVTAAYARVETQAPAKKGTPEQFQKFLFNNHCSTEATPAFR